MQSLIKTTILNILVIAELPMNQTRNRRRNTCDNISAASAFNQVSLRGLFGTAFGRKEAKRAVRGKENRKAESKTA